MDIGCGNGALLGLLRDLFITLKDYDLHGLDPNRDSINSAKKELPAVDFGVGEIGDLTGEYGCIIADAVLMYIPPNKIAEAMDKICGVSKKVIICDWHDESEEGVVKDDHWARNYKALLEKRGYSVKTIKVDRNIWPTSESWINYGVIYYGERN